MVENKGVEKICSLYVNQMHLIVMLIPYIEKELENGNKVFTILETDLREEVGTLINKVNLSRKKKKGLKAINWDKTKLSYEQVESIKDEIVLVNGSYDFIKEVNRFLSEKNRKIINCFNLETFENNSREILEGHDKILNTLGEKEISEMFHQDMAKIAYWRNSSNSIIYNGFDL